MIAFASVFRIFDFFFLVSFFFSFVLFLLKKNNNIFKNFRRFYLNPFLIFLKKNKKKILFFTFQ